MTSLKTVLIVDDVPDNILILTSLLQKDFKVKAATSGKRALNLSNSRDHRPDLILLDVMMPEMTGYDVCEQLKANPATADIPIIFLTSLTEAQDEAKGFRLGAVDYIHKPFNPVVVCARIEAVLDRERLRNIEKLYLANITRELDVARQIQASILPKMFPNLPGLIGHGLMVPAREVGGDFFDFIPIDEDRVGIAVADVSGKGVPAAFFMAIARTLLRAIAQFNLSPGACLARLNEALSAENDQAMFVTVFYGILDSRSGEFCYANGGHNPAALTSADGKVIWLPGTGGALLGIYDYMTYSEKTVQLKPDESLFIYTDGVVESFDVHGNEFTNDRLEKVLGRCGRLSPTEMTKAVLLAVKEFEQGTTQADDITCVGIRYIGRG